jgi:hypothetical protein
MFNFYRSEDVKFLISFLSNNIYQNKAHIHVACHQIQSVQDNIQYRYILLLLTLHHPLLIAITVIVCEGITVKKLKTGLGGQGAGLGVQIFEWNFL